MYFLGYRVLGVSGTNLINITCHHDGKWTTSSQVCIPSQCTKPPVVNAAIIEQTSRYTDYLGVVHQSVVYRCIEKTWISNGFFKVLFLTFNFIRFIKLICIEMV